MSAHSCSMGSPVVEWQYNFHCPLASRTGHDAFALCLLVTKRQQYSGLVHYFLSSYGRSKDNKKVTTIVSLSFVHTLIMYVVYQCYTIIRTQRINIIIIIFISYILCCSTHIFITYILAWEHRLIKKYVSIDLHFHHHGAISSFDGDDVPAWWGPNKFLAKLWVRIFVVPPGIGHLPKRS